MWLSTAVSIYIYVCVDLRQRFSRRLLLLPFLVDSTSACGVSIWVQQRVVAAQHYCSWAVVETSLAAQDISLITRSVMTASHKSSEQLSLLFQCITSCFIALLAVAYDIQLRIWQVLCFYASFAQLYALRCRNTSQGPFDCVQP